MEALVLPMRSGNAALISDFDQFFAVPVVQTTAISQAILREAAQLRATHRWLKTPDAIHAATAFAKSATMFLSNDRGFRVIPGLPLALLDDILASP
jgi:predicted nucleic acid-binding protein